MAFKVMGIVAGRHGGNSEILAENGLVRDRNKNEARSEHLNEIVQTRIDFFQHRDEMEELRKKYRDMTFPTITV